jgi:hypothetical protein
VAGCPSNGHNAIGYPRVGMLAYTVGSPLLSAQTMTSRGAGAMMQSERLRRHRSGLDN